MEYTVTEYVSEKAIVRVHKPILTEEEYNKRQEAFLYECDKMMREYYALKPKEAQTSAACNETA